MQSTTTNMKTVSTRINWKKYVQIIDTDKIKEKLKEVVYINDKIDLITKEMLESSNKAKKNYYVKHKNHVLTTRNCQKNQIQTQIRW